MTLKDWLAAAGKVDGAISAGALAVAGYASFAPAVTKDALLVAGLAGALGALLNVGARFVGVGPVAPTAPPPPAS